MSDAVEAGPSGKLVEINGGKDAEVERVRAEFAKMCADLGEKQITGFAISLTLADGGTTTGLSTDGPCNIFHLIGAVEWAAHRLKTENVAGT